MSADNLELVRRSGEAFSRKDPDEILGFFTDDAVYHNMPLPLRGKAAIRPVLEMFLKPSASVEFVILNRVAAGDIVLAERIDRFVMSGQVQEVDGSNPSAPAIAPSCSTLE